MDKKKNSTFQTLCTNRIKYEREINDFYATEPKATELLLEVEPELNNIWECACGQGHLAKVFDKYGKLGKASDLIDRGYGIQEDFINNIVINFNPYFKWEGDIVTNPPYSLAEEFIKKALEIINNGNKVCMFLRLLFLEGKGRKELFTKYPPKTVYVCSGRINTAKDANFDLFTNGAMANAWFVWQKGYKGYPIIQWIN